MHDFGWKWIATGALTIVALFLLIKFAFKVVLVLVMVTMFGLLSLIVGMILYLIFGGY